jgi:hypothetical protein
MNYAEPKDINFNYDSPCCSGLLDYKDLPHMNKIRLTVFNGHKVTLRMILGAELVDLEA